MKYLLIEVIERDINTPEIFETHDDAHDRMCEYVAEVLDVSREDIKESYFEGEDFNENTGVIENDAWTERCGNNFDWKIFTINDAVKSYERLIL